MTKPRKLKMPKSRFLSSIWQVGSYLGHGGAWFRTHREELEASGFPTFDELIGGWDKDAIDVWLDGRSGLNVGIKVVNHD